MSDAFSIPGGSGSEAAALAPLRARLGALSKLHDASPMEQARTAAQNEFAAMLSQSMAARSSTNKRTTDMTEADKETQARQVAQDFVAVAFVQPILKNLRNSHMGAELPPPLGPGPGEKQFRTLADTQVSRQLVKATNWPLVDTLTRTLLTKRPKPGSVEAITNAPAQPGSPAGIRRSRGSGASLSPTPESQTAPAPTAAPLDETHP